MNIVDQMKHYQDAWMLRAAAPVRVLVVDDEPGILHALATFLAPYHVEVVTAGSVQEALVHAGEAFDLAVIDLRLGGPGADGIGLIRQLRRHNPTWPVCLLSGYLTTEVVERALNEVGCVAFARKPADMNQAFLFELFAMFNLHRKIPIDLNTHRVETEPQSPEA